RSASACQRGFVQFQTEPGKQAPADVSTDVELYPGLVTGELTDFILVVIGVEQVSQGETQRDDDQQQSEDYQAQDLAERFHGRILVFGMLKSASIAPRDVAGPQMPAGPAFAVYGAGCLTGRMLSE